MPRVRMGLHRHPGGFADDAFRAYVERVRPPWVKMLEEWPPRLVEFCHERGVSVVGRVWFEHQPLGAEADRNIDRVVATMHGAPDVDAWEIYNEAHQSGDAMARYAEHCVEFMQACEVHDTTAVIGSFSTGQPELVEWHRFLPALEYAASGGHYVGLHEYSAPTMQWGAGHNQWNDGDFRYYDAAEWPGVQGWWTLRYRRHVEEWIFLGVNPVPRILITEGGIDDIQPRPGPAGKGWRDYTGEPWGRGMPGQTDMGHYADQWRWYCDRLSEDAYVHGAVDFGWGTARHPSEGIRQWRSFDLSADPPMLAAMIAAMSTDVAPEPPPPPPPPPPPDPEPRVTGAVRPCVIVQHGEGKAALAGRAAGWPDASYQQRMAWWREIAEHNRTAPGVVLHPGQWFEVPWFEVRDA